MLEIGHRRRRLLLSLAKGGFRQRFFLIDSIIIQGSFKSFLAVCFIDCGAKTEIQQPRQRQKRKYGANKLKDLSSRWSMDVTISSGCRKQ